MKKLLITLALLSSFGLNGMEKNDQQDQLKIYQRELTCFYIRPGYLFEKEIIIYASPHSNIDHLKKHKEVSAQEYKKWANIFIHPKTPLSDEIGNEFTQELTKLKKNLSQKNANTRNDLYELQSHFSWNMKKNITGIIFATGVTILCLKGASHLFNQCTNEKIIKLIKLSQVTTGVLIGGLGTKFVTNRVQDAYSDYSKLQTTKDILTYNACVQKALDDKLKKLESKSFTDVD